MNKSAIETIVEKKRDYFTSGATLPYEFRIAQLKKLKKALKQNEQRIMDAIYNDFRKPGHETFLCEISLVYEEINFHMRHLKSWMQDKRVKTPVTLFPAKSYISYEPFGVTLIISPWNYPVLLCLQPLVGAISAGNCAVIKPSAYTPNTSSVIKDLIESAFPEEYISVIEGGREENKALLEEKFDYIFFTGSVNVGKEVMAAAAKNLTPVTLELGGKSPAVIDKSADVKIAARRIAFGKVLNAGQTCVAPDYALIHESLHDSFIQEYEKVLDIFFPLGDMHDMPVIVNDKHFERVSSLLRGGYPVIGGGFDEQRRFMEPTVLTDVDLASPLMKEEIFGPILPLIPYSDIEEAIGFVRERPRPLALYLFTNDGKVEKRVFGACSFGGGCVNDTIMHLVNPHLPFGGVGSSGMGKYHGKESFKTFSNSRSVLKKGTKLDSEARYHPYTQNKEKLLRLLFR